jgi:hypothetical protein
MLEFDQKFCQNRMLNICWFQNNKETKTRHVSLKDEMWPQNKMRNDKSIIKWWTIQHHSWISFSSHICVLPSNFDHLSFWGCSGDKMINDIIFHKLSSILETLVSVQLKWSKNPPWYSHLVWIIPRWLHANLSKWVQQVWNLTDDGRQTWVADECQS